MSKDFDIRLADKTHVDSCVEILQDSELGKAYFSDIEKATDMLSYAVAQNNVLHIIAVKEEYRSHGIGKQLMRFFEDNASDQPRAKYFLTVDDFNPRARNLYESIGYKCVGELPDFYKQGINCYLMMKTRGIKNYRN